MWAFAGFWLGALCGGGLGDLIAIVTDRTAPGMDVILGVFMAGGFAAGGAVVGAVRDILTCLHRRSPPSDGPESDYRDQPFQDLPTADPGATL